MLGGQNLGGFMSRILSAIFCGVLLSLAACTGEDTAGSSVTSSSSADLLACTAAEYGNVMWAADSSHYYACDGSYWILGYPSTVSSSSIVADSLSSSVIESSSSVYVHVPGFDPCRFNFGAGWQAAHEDSSFYAGLDYISVWLGDNDYFNDFERRMLDVAISINATPMIYAYVIAELGKDMGMVDCDIKDVSGAYVLPNHCTEGANLIRQHFADSVLYRYQQYAEGFSDYLTFYYPEIDISTYKMIWLIEPDFYQYSVSGSVQDANFDQEGGGISDAEMGTYFAQIVSTIRTYLPASKIAIDISPWIKDPAAWYANFDLSTVDYASTSGGRTLAGSAKIRSANTMTWADAYAVTGKPILADAGYDAGGQGTGHNTPWDLAANINARIADGVIGITQMDAASDYAARLDTIRPQLNSVTAPWCTAN